MFVSNNFSVIVVAESTTFRSFGRHRYASGNKDVIESYLSCVFTQGQPSFIILNNFNHK